MLRALEDPSNQDAWMQHCVEGENILGWGFMTQEQIQQWWEGGDDNFELNLQHLATNGPSGLRLGLLGNQTADSPSMLTFIRDKFETQTHESSANFHFNHTIAQPVCENTLHDALTTT